MWGFLFCQYDYFFFAFFGFLASLRAPIPFAINIKYFIYNIFIISF